MKSSMLRRVAALSVLAAAAIAPTAAFADPPGIYYFNDGNGTCGYYQITPYGVQVIDTFPCPREVSGD